jgi:hypothetical protein
MSNNQPGKLRIFVTTSHISTVYMTLLAKATCTKEYTDILLLDGGYRREELLKLINDIATYHSWQLVHSFSEHVEANHDFKPTLRKRLTRKWKTLPLIRSFYQWLLQKHTVRKEEQYKSTLLKLLPQINAGQKVEFYMITQTHIGATLSAIFPAAKKCFMEHGIGDYFYVQEKNEPDKKFFAIFSAPFRKYLEQSAQPFEYVHPIPGLENFSSFAAELLRNNSFTLPEIPSQTKPVVFILLEAVDMYNVPINFWKEYLEHITQQLASPEQYHYIMKTHPIQSGVSIANSEAFFREKNYTYTLLAGEKLSSVSVEVLFTRWADQTDHVFCLFSSGCFYLSQLYKNKNITFWYSTKFMSRYIGNAPPQYKKHYEGLRPIIENVFAENCKPY